MVAVSPTPFRTATPSPTASPEPTDPKIAPTPHAATPSPSPTPAALPAILPAGAVFFTGRVTEKNTGLPMQVSVTVELFDTAHDAWAPAGAAASDGFGNYVVQAVAPTIGLLTGSSYKLSLLGTYLVSFRAQGYQLNLWKNSSTYGTATELIVGNWGVYRGIDASMAPCQSSFDPGCS